MSDESVVVILVGFNVLERGDISFFVPHHGENITIWDAENALDRAEAVKERCVILLKAGSAMQDRVFNMDSNLPILLFIPEGVEPEVVTDKHYSTIRERAIATSSELTAAAILAQAINMVALEKTEIHWS